jgi:ribosomal protein L37E
VICLEVYRNGEKLRTIGEEEASYIRLNSVCFVDQGYSNLQVFVEKQSFYSFMRRTPHFGINVELGDEISVKLVEAAAPDPVDPSPPMGSRQRDDTHELLCSLCGKSSKKVKRMVGTAVGFICSDCIEVAYETIKMPPAVDAD